MGIGHRLLAFGGIGQKLCQCLGLLVFGSLARCFRRGLLLGFFGGLLLGRLRCRLLLGFFRRLLLGLFGGFLLGLLSRLLLGQLLGGLLLRDLGLLLLLYLLRLFGFLGRSGLIGSGFRRFGLSSLLGLLLFRSLRRSLLLLLDLALLHLLGFVLFGSRLLRLAGNLLVGLRGRLALGLQLIKRCLHDRLGWRQLGCHGKADEQHAEDDDVQADRQHGRPEIALRR